MIKKIISYSLWGNNPKYIIGAIENAKLAQNIYDNWISRFYIDLNINDNIVNNLLGIGNTEIVRMNIVGDWSGMFWRFLPAIEDDINIMISRDTDSRLSLREKYAVDEWLSSNKDFHIMRDHPYHNTHILGGMWGVRNNLFKRLNIEIPSSSGNYWQVDQDFLRNKVYPLIKNHAFVHDSFSCMNEPFAKKFPTKRIDKHFVGEIYDENNFRHPDHYTLIK